VFANDPIGPGQRSAVVILRLQRSQRVVRPAPQNRKQVGAGVLEVGRDILPCNEPGAGVTPHDIGTLRGRRGTVFRVGIAEVENVLVLAFGEHPVLLRVVAKGALFAGLADAVHEQASEPVLAGRSAQFVE